MNDGHYISILSVFCSLTIVGFIPAAASFMNFSLRDADEDW